MYLFFLIDWFYYKYCMDILTPHTHYIISNNSIYNEMPHFSRLKCMFFIFNDLLYKLKITNDTFERQ